MGRVRISRLRVRVNVIHVFHRGIHVRGVVVYLFPLYVHVTIGTITTTGVGVTDVGVIGVLCALGVLMCVLGHFSTVCFIMCLYKCFLVCMCVCLCVCVGRGYC